ncbi:MAG: L,D-transpeptidase [Anaerolineales bacterium]|nr:L,D-transpeptidase [Anaerolineales bacterium]MCX7609102.1 L,D-transpeptidase [Anaerolineales bacterium]MDW8227835.1 L,D-transpeptidase [Anaerolineales bacterium]
MLRWSSFLLCLMLVWPTFRWVNSSLGSSANHTEVPSGAVVCPPGIYTLAPEDCLVSGPAQEMTRLAQEGIIYPLLPLPAYPPDSSLNELPYQYFRVNKSGAPIFLSLQDAIANQPWRRLEAGFLYVSYRSLVETEAGGFYLLRDGTYIPADGSRTSIPIFQGLLFSATPRHAFGWVLEKTPSYQAPGRNAPETGKVYYRYQVVSIFRKETVNEALWLLIGPDEWLPANKVARVEPRQTPPDGVTGNRWIEINLEEQTLAAYEDNRLRFATLVSSGIAPFWTRPGLFQIYEKKELETMSGAFEPDRSDYYYLQDVPWTMYFDQKRALHGQYWHTGLGYPRSHGCVNLSVGDARWLYEWASLEDWVYVYDPSGRTPTDPSLYGSGAP